MIFSANLFWSPHYFLIRFYVIFSQEDMRNYDFSDFM